MLNHNSYSAQDHDMELKGYLITRIPFSGFYNSIHEWMFDAELESICDLDGMTPDDAQNFASEFSWNDNILNGYAKEYLARIESDFDFENEIIFSNVQSPKYYNYSNDKIFAYVHKNDIQKIYLKISKEKLSDYIFQRFSSCDGFISHYPNHLDTWLNVPVTQWDHNQLGTLLDVYFESENDCYESNVTEELYEVTMNLIYDNLTDTQNEILAKYEN